MVGSVATQSYNPVAEFLAEFCISCSCLYRQHKSWGCIPYPKGDPYWFVYISHHLFVQVNIFFIEGFFYWVLISVRRECSFYFFIFHNSVKELRNSSSGICGWNLNASETRRYDPVVELLAEFCISCTSMYRQDKIWGYIPTQREVPIGLYKFLITSLYKWRLFFIGFQYLQRATCSCCSSYFTFSVEELRNLSFGIWGWNLKVSETQRYNSVVDFGQTGHCISPYT